MQSARVSDGAWHTLEVISLDTLIPGILATWPIHRGCARGPPWGVILGGIPDFRAESPGPPSMDGFPQFLFQRCLRGNVPWI